MMNDDTQQLPAYGVRVTDLGAKGDRLTNDSPAIQKALDGGHDLVVVPKGVYRLRSTLRIRSGTRLVADPEAQFVFADRAGENRDCYLITNADHNTGNEGISIEGGIWDGNCENNPRGQDKPRAYTGVLINFVNCTDLQLRDMTVRDASSYFIRIGEVSRFVIERIRFEAPTVRPNQDGVHLGGFCQDGVIQDLVGTGKLTPNDDLVALNADDALHRAQNLGLRCGPIRRIHVRNLRAEECHSFVRLLSVESPIEDILIEDLAGGCRVCAVNADACRTCAIPVIDENNPRHAEGVGDVRRVTIRDVDVHKTSAASAKALFDLQTFARGLNIRNVTRDPDRDACPQAPTVAVSLVPGSEVVLEGLTGQQLADMRMRSGRVIHRAGRMKTLVDEVSWRVESHLTKMNEEVILPTDGFQRLVQSMLPTTERGVSRA